MMLSHKFIPFAVIFLAGEIVFAEHKDFKWLVKEELFFLNGLLLKFQY